MIYRLIIFLALNFSALAIGGLFTSKGVPSDFINKSDYNESLNKEQKRVRVAGNLFSPVKGSGTLKGTNRFVFVRLAQLF